MTYQDILIVGAGLMGTSVALALRQACPCLRIDAVEPNPKHRAEAMEHGVFGQLFADCNDVQASYDLLFLAAPSSVSLQLLPLVASRATLVVDLCSVKRPICAMARSLDLGQQFVPSHPMAGKASGGPRDADAKLFLNRPWLFLQNWSVPDELCELVAMCGAKPTWVADEAAHDEMMAAVSHGIHLTSLGAMLASHRSRADAPTVLPSVSGPALWDVTRLAASPTAFWIDTLLSNRAAVIAYLQELQEQLQAFAAALADEDAQRLASLLQAAQAARAQWEATRDSQQKRS